MTEYTKRKLDNFIRSPYTKPIDVGFIKEIALDVFDGCSMQEIQKYLFTQIQTFKPKNEIEGKNLGNLVLSYAHNILLEKDKNIQDIEKTRLHHQTKDAQQYLCRLYEVDYKCTQTLTEMANSLKNADKDYFKMPRRNIIESLESPTAIFADRFDIEFQKVFKGTKSMSVYNRIDEEIQKYIHAYDNNNLKQAEQHRNNIKELRKELLETMKEETEEIKIVCFEKYNR